MSCTRTATTCRSRADLAAEAITELEAAVDEFQEMLRLLEDPEAIEAEAGG